MASVIKKFPEEVELEFKLTLPPHCIDFWFNGIDCYVPVKFDGKLDLNYNGVNYVALHYYCDSDDERCEYGVLISTTEVQGVSANVYEMLKNGMAVRLYVKDGDYFLVRDVY